MQQNNLCRQNTIRGLYRPRIAFWRQNNFKKKLFGFTHWWKFSIVIQKETLLWRRFSGSRHFMEFFRIWKKSNIYWNLLKLIPMSLFRKKSLRSTFCSSETLQTLPYFMFKKTHVVFFHFSFRATLGFYLMNALVYVDIDQGIH